MSGSEEEEERAGGGRSGVCENPHFPPLAFTTSSREFAMLRRHSSLAEESGWFDRCILSEYLLLRNSLEATVEMKQFSVTGEKEADEERRREAAEPPPV